MAATFPSHGEIYRYYARYYSKHQAMRERFAFVSDHGQAAWIFFAKIMLKLCII